MSYGWLTICTERLCRSLHQRTSHGCWQKLKSNSSFKNETLKISVCALRKPTPLSFRSLVEYQKINKFSRNHRFFSDLKEGNVSWKRFSALPWRKSHGRKRRILWHDPRFLWPQLPVLIRSVHQSGRPYKP